MSVRKFLESAWKNALEEMPLVANIPDNIDRETAPFDLTIFR